MTALPWDTQAEPLTWPDFLPDHLSASTLTQFHRCPEQLRIAKVAKRPEPPKGYRIWGSADSSAAEHNYSQKIDTHADVPVSEVMEVFALAVDDEVDKWGGASQIDWAKEESAANVKDAGVKLAALYHTKAAPSVQPIASEGRIEFSLPGVSVPIIGYIDVETEARIIERKTAAAKFKKGVPDGSYLAQARVYQLALAKPLHFHVSTKTKLPAVYTPADPECEGMALSYDDAEMERTVRWIQTTALAIQTYALTFGEDGPWPGAEALRDSPCSWCGFGPNAANSCRWHV